MSDRSQILRKVRLWVAGGAAGLVLLPLTAVTTAPLVSAANNFCAELGHGLGASAGAHMYCDYIASPHQAALKARAAVKAQVQQGANAQNGGRQFGNNVDSANPSEDQTAATAQTYGQSETSIAAIGPYVVHAWNDAMGFFQQCDGTQTHFNEELTGFGFSTDGGRTFTDEGGLPNDCTTGAKFFGDPSVETWQTGGKTYFYISSLFISLVTGQSFIAMDACPVTGSTISCHGPIVIAAGGPTDFLDKDYFSIDPARGRLYNSYTRFDVSSPSAPNFQGQIELAACDLTADPANPTCDPGSSTAPYTVIQAGQSCENEGAYPAVDVATGDVYVAWEYNWATDLGPGAAAPVSCESAPHQNRIALVGFGCLTLPVNHCGGAVGFAQVTIWSIDLAFIPGFNRVPGQIGNAPGADFPRIAVSDPAGTVSITWNDTGRSPTADILLQSYKLGSLAPVQSQPVRLNAATGGGTWNFMPGLRNADSQGRLNVSWYQQQEPGALTDVVAALNIDPRINQTPDNVRITTASTGWHDVSSDIIPNFGDYTDNYVLATASAPYTDRSLFVSWSDGRLGIPQPFMARTGGGGGD